MLGCAGVLAQEIVKPDVFFYTAPQQIELPFNAAGLFAFQIFVMHWTELRRISDILKPGSVDQDPIFSNNKLPPHEPSYPGGIFAPFIPGMQGVVCWMYKVVCWMCGVVCCVVKILFQSAGMRN